ncbi:MAG TPA: hypothetical protein VFQ60_01220, partial [Patescibacteria group bacterium]|nr:hypothetical protein [Patescibacteria group bacterium]
MKWDAWLLSAKLAWMRPTLRWTTLTTLAIIVFGSFLFLWNVVPARKQSGMLIIHYNIYLGVDQVRPWQWIFFLPALWLLLSLIDFALAFGLYHHDAHVSASLIFLAFFFA